MAVNKCVRAAGPEMPWVLYRIAAEDPELFEISPEQKADLERRMSAHRSDPASAIHWDQVLKKLFQRT